MSLNLMRSIELKLYSLKMLGTESEFSICVSHAFEMWNSELSSASAIRWLNSATSRVVIPKRLRISLSCSLGGSARAMRHSTTSPLENCNFDWAVGGDL